ncbi:HupE/UreJ family protein [Rhodospirillaceae bacterium KN72]|uniref:HupE/UreJ family protein n=1 Tax=Pacificispira spongiicola TaxID=2729598 RepID=A0A7Y0DZV8_9PROT|nr:HupE/UreJ family protein [Pacificispira spongiicola]NMM44624.1 HupE/UreJ family protein [Pacificispira spongiicola]
MTKLRNYAPIAAILLAATPAFAHTGATGATGLGTGFGHPMGGADHLLAMIAVGILAAQQGGRALYLLPLAFVGMMIVGAAASIGGIPLPFVEVGIVGSVILLGFVIALGRHMPVAASALLVGALAVFHGHAHGTEMPLSVSGLEYGLGFVAATALLHVAGIALTRMVSVLGSETMLRFGGAGIATAGLALAVA